MALACTCRIVKLAPAHNGRFIKVDNQEGKNVRWLYRGWRKNHTPYFPLFWWLLDTLFLTFYLSTACIDPSNNRDILCRGSFIVPSFDEIWPQAGKEKEKEKKKAKRMGLDYILEVRETTTFQIVCDQGIFGAFSP